MATGVTDEDLFTLRAGAKLPQFNASFLRERDQARLICSKKSLKETILVLHRRGPALERPRHGDQAVHPVITLGRDRE